jgi:hypothetical protein
MYGKSSQNYFYPSANYGSWGRGGGASNRGHSTRGGYSSATSSRILAGLGSLGGQIDVPSVAPGMPVATIRDFKTVASYNWIDSSTASIIVPGKPNSIDPNFDFTAKRTIHRFATCLE